MRNQSNGRRRRGVLVAAVLGAMLPGAASGAIDYLLAEGPANGSLELERTSYDEFGDRIEEVLGDGGPLGKYLTGRFPSFGDFFSGAEVSVRPRSYYRYVRRPGGIEQEAFAVGGALELQSGWWNDAVQFGMTGYTSQEIHGPAGRGGTGLLTADQDSISVLGALWAKARWKQLSLQVGRGEIDLPYLNRNDSRMIPQTFEMLTVYYQPSECITVGVGHFSRIKRRDTDEFIAMSKAAGARGSSEGVTTAGLVWKAGDGFELAVFNHFGWDTYNTLYSELLWRGPDTRLPLDWTVGLQFTDQRSVGDELVGDFDSQHYGAKIAAGYKSVLMTLAATKTSNEGRIGIRNSWGGSPAYLSSMISDFDRPGELAGRLSMQASLDGVTEGLSTAVSLAAGETDHGLDQRSRKECDLTIDYRSPRFDGLWLRARGAWQDRGGDRTEDYRVILNYEKTF